MRLIVTFSKAEAEAVLRAELSAGHGIRRSRSLQTAESKIRHAIATAKRSDEIAAEGTA